MPQIRSLLLVLVLVWAFGVPLASRTTDLSGAPSAPAPPHRVRFAFVTLRPSLSPIEAYYLATLVQADSFAPWLIGITGARPSQRSAAEALLSTRQGRILLRELAFDGPIHAKLQAIWALWPSRGRYLLGTLRRISRSQQPITFAYGCVLGEVSATEATMFIASSGRAMPQRF